MEYIEIIKKSNPSVFNIFKNSFTNNKISHAYLFSAPREIAIENEPLFLSQILISPDPFNGKTRMLKKYVDFQVIDNNSDIIKKEQITESINKLQDKPFERDGKKILLIKNVERASIKALNSLLKFLEEPTPNTFLIFTTNNLSKILPTIKSRTQIIHVNKKARNNVVENFLSNGFEKEDALLLSEFTSSINEANEFKKELKELKVKLLNILEQSILKKEIIYTELYKIINKKNAKLSLNLINSFFSDIWRQKYGIETSFNNIDLIGKFIDINFNFRNALIETSNFLKNTNISINFDLYKSNFLLSLKRLYG